MIAIVWLLSFIIMIPIAVYQKLVPLGDHAHKCLEQWDSPTLEKGYTIFLDMALLIIPLISMFTAYWVISVTLWRGIQKEMRDSQGDILNNFVSEPRVYMIITCLQVIL